MPLHASLRGKFPADRLPASRLPETKPPKPDRDLNRRHGPGQLLARRSTRDLISRDSRLYLVYIPPRSTQPSHWRKSLVVLIGILVDSTRKVEKSVHHRDRARCSSLEDASRIRRKLRFESLEDATQIVRQELREIIDFFETVRFKLFQERQPISHF
ncbi:PREDICTED: uncharacterized protein LOC105154165 [Acromyrmex echinatior]|uniref:uncharacterized protein LOC105154165 n=1 Tax=Acromyrmex echinatior TaxID=103372 RepID=UPI000580DA5F|nr:PREDICTED: uncharacterized protein LOC105154165 [Acromyrmex echinatior]